MERNDWRSAETTDCHEKQRRHENYKLQCITMQSQCLITHVWCIMWNNNVQCTNINYWTHTSNTVWKSNENPQFNSSLETDSENFSEYWDKKKPLDDKIYLRVRRKQFLNFSWRFSFTFSSFKVAMAARRYGKATIMSQNQTIFKGRMFLCCELQTLIYLNNVLNSTYLNIWVFTIWIRNSTNIEIDNQKN